MKNEILELLSNKNFYVNLKNSFYKEIKTQILEYGINNLVKEINSDIKAKSFYHGLWNNRILLKDLLSISKIFNLSLDSIYSNIEHIYYRTGKQGDKIH